jgi:peptide/nickel transport system permease protein
MTTADRGGLTVRELSARYQKNRAAVFGLGAVSFFFLVALFGPAVAPYGPFDLSEEAFARPSRAHLLGTDNVGRDVVSGVIYGARASLLVGFLAVLTSTVIGMAVGAFSGFYGGRIDDLLMRVTEIFQVLPRFFLAILFVAFFGPAIWNVILVIGILSWPETARLLRAEFLALRQREFVEAARAMGAGDLRLMVSAIMPNAISPVIVSASLQVAGAILLESGLSFLGLGDPNVISWGFMLHNAQEYFHHAWWMATFPGGALFLAALGLNLVGDGLNDALNPRLRAR